jgi:hypothetical protein
LCFQSAAGIGVMTDRFTYQFKSRGTGPAGTHCTYCPRQQNEHCDLTCSKEYERLEEERRQDGCIVIDTVPE